jgi:hypothetical protein
LKQLGIDRALDSAGQRHRTTRDVNLEVSRVDPKSPFCDLLADLALQLVVGSDEGPNEIRSGHDPHKLVPVDYGEPVHPVFNHHASRLGQGPAGRDRYRGRSHRLARVPRLQPGLPLAALKELPDEAGPLPIPGGSRHDVRLGHNTDNGSVFDDGKT